MVGQSFLGPTMKVGPTEAIFTADDEADHKGRHYK